MPKCAVQAAFEKQIVTLPLDIIVPQKEVTKGHRECEFYKQISYVRDAGYTETAL